MTICKNIYSLNWQNLTFHLRKFTDKFTCSKRNSTSLLLITQISILHWVNQDFCLVGLHPLHTPRPVIPKGQSQVLPLWVELRVGDWLTFEIETLDLLLLAEVPEVHVAITTDCAHKAIGTLVRMKTQVMDWVEHRFIFVTIWVFLFVALESHDVVSSEAHCVMSLNRGEVGSAIT